MTALDCVLVNNMPDGAFVQAERQFGRLVEAGAGGPVQLRRYSLSRPGPGYLPLSDLWGTTADAVIVTGAEPGACVLPEEPTWPELTRLLDWIAERAGTALLSCQAAHAALRHFDGAERVRLPAKCSGVYTHRVAPHPVTRGLPPDIPLPHSRHNTVPATVLQARGHDLLIASDDADWAVAAARYGGSQVLLIQAHPEYDGDTLLREYRRDAGRHLRGEQDEWPVLPCGYLREADEARIEEWRRRPAGDFPFEELSRGLDAPWAAPSGRLYANWLAGARHRSLSTKAG